MERGGRLWLSGEGVGRRSWDGVGGEGLAVGEGGDGLWTVVRVEGLLVLLLRLCVGVVVELRGRGERWRRSIRCVRRTVRSARAGRGNKEVTHRPFLPIPLHKSSRPH